MIKMYRLSSPSVDQSLACYKLFQPKMNGYLPRQTHGRLCWMLRSFLLVACIQSLQAYSFSAPQCDRGMQTHADDIAIYRPPNNDDNSVTIGRRALFQRGSAALASVAIHPQPAHAASSTPPIGSPAPHFSLLNSRGQIVTLDSLTADKKWTILYFYPGAFTSGCTLEARRFNEDLPSYQKLNAQVVGVSVDSVEKNSGFCTSEGLDFFMLTDEVSIYLLVAYYW